MPNRRQQVAAALCAGLLVCATAHAQPPAAPVADSVLARDVAAMVAADTGFSGVVVLGRAGRVVATAARGRARPGGAVPSAETAFNLGSITKVFTTILVRQVAAEQGWSLDTTLRALWPSYPNDEVASRVTVRQLLEHRSGVGGSIFGDTPAARDRLRTLADVHALVVQRPLDFAPGTREAYSNAGYVVLGRLLEVRTGRSYFDLVAERIYRPAGMTRSGHFGRDSLPPFTAVGTTRDGGTARSNLTTLPFRGSSAGGSYASAADLLRFVQALRMRTLAAAPPPGIGIAGGSPGVNAILEGDLPGGLDLVVLANVDPPAAERMARTIRQRMGLADD
jgi:CubicO group peptidase (beta-lactamase class C family)